MPERCPWPRNPTAIAYHDEEWGVPVHDDRKFFEYLVLDAAQAGLSWDTILQRRAGYRRVFVGFDPVKVARFDRAKIVKALTDPGIIRNRAKVEWTVKNARAFLKVQDEVGSFDALIWQFVGGKPIINRWTGHKQIPAETAESQAMSKDLRRRGFGFVGPTICYAFMQASGLVNDHLITCPRHGACRTHK